MTRVRQMSTGAGFQIKNPRGIFFGRLQKTG
jgi:hypothetical protein